MKERLQKIISAYGITSRRNAEKLISDGKVCVNGAVASLGDSADPEYDSISVNGTLLSDVKKSQRVCIALNKPTGYLSTVSDDRGRKTVMDLVHSVGCRVYPAGRLDYDSSGLLIMTNDGDLANIIMHPSKEKNKIYSVRVKGDIKSALPKLNKPMDIDGYTIRPANVTVIRDDGTSALLRFVIHEGRNRQIRKMCAQSGLDVITLHRTAIDRVELGSLKPGEWRFLTESEISSLT